MAPVEATRSERVSSPRSAVADDLRQSSLLRLVRRRRALAFQPPPEILHEHLVLAAGWLTRTPPSVSPWPIWSTHSSWRRIESALPTASYSESAVTSTV